MVTVGGLSPSIIRMLHDKLYEKRKIAALEIEKLVKASSNEGDTDEIQKTVSLLAAKFTMSQNPNSRKGGLIGLAACAIALGSQNIQPFLESLIKPVLLCSFDPDSRMRYFACESLYNIVKVSRADTLPYFNELFDALSKLSADSDPNVRNGSDLLDRLLKDIVTETPSFDVTTFVVLLRDRLYTKKQFTRRFLVQWLICIMSIPEVDTLAFLPELLDGLFLILEDQSKEIRTMCKSTLGEFMTKIENTPEKVDFCSMINIVIFHCQSNDNLIKETALVWMQKFILLAAPDVLKFASGIIGAILPTLAYDDATHKNIKTTARQANQCLMKLVTNKYDKNNETSLSLPLSEIIEVFTTHLHYQSTLNQQNHHYKSTATKSAVIRWITHLLVKIPYSMFDHIERIFNELMHLLADKADDVVLQTLECLAEIASSPAGIPLNNTSVSGTRASTSIHGVTSNLVLNNYFTKLISRLLDMFKANQDLLEMRSSFIIRQLCALLNPDNVYRALADILTFKNEEGQSYADPRFCAHAVKKLNTILMTSSELVELRNRLKNDVSQDTNELFICLYKSWCHNPIASVTLCLLTQNYMHCCRLLQKFSHFELTVEFLVDMDKLVQLLESPVFSYLRLQLLSPSKYYLTKSLYSLLMLLPQSRPFDTLLHRLNCVPNLHSLPPTSKSSADSENGNLFADIDFDNLFNHFIFVQSKHSDFKKYNRLQATSVNKTL